MITSRRGFLRWVGANSTAGMAMHWPMMFASGATTLEPSMRDDGFVRLDRNENAYGPSPKVQDIIRSSSGANRYALGESRWLLEKIAGLNHVKSDQVLLGCGSTENLRRANRTKKALPI